jgi:hypothetical protein
MATAASILHRTAPSPAQGAWLRWTAIVAIGEILAFSIPLTLGVVASEVWDLGGFALWGVVVAAGAGEGLVLGIAQAIALKSFFPRVNSLLWVAATVVGATAAWAFAWLTPTYHGRGEPAGIIAGIAIVGGVVGLIALTVPQAEVLAFAKTRLAYMWIPFAAFAWAVALPAVLLGGLFVDESSSAVEIVSAFAVGAAAMAIIMAAITGRAMCWLAAHNRPAA